MRSPHEVPIRDESIRLGQLLKLAGVVDDGATAREVIEAGLVAVNGEVDTRRGRQVRPGDIVGAVKRGMEERTRPTIVDVVVTRDPAKMLPGVDQRTAPIKKGDRIA